jgi:hypothetical protein
MNMMWRLLTVVISGGTQVAEGASYEAQVVLNAPRRVPLMSTGSVNGAARQGSTS